MSRPVTCPHCGSARAVPIAYGMPGLEMVEKADRGEVVLGGCLVNDDAPIWTCRDCDHTWGRLADLTERNG